MLRHCGPKQQADSLLPFPRRKNACSMDNTCSKARCRPPWSQCGQNLLDILGPLVAVSQEQSAGEHGMAGFQLSSTFSVFPQLVLILDDSTYGRICNHPKNADF